MGRGRRFRYASLETGIRILFKGKVSFGIKVQDLQKFFVCECPFRQIEAAGVSGINQLVRIHSLTGCGSTESNADVMAADVQQSALPEGSTAVLLSPHRTG